MLVVNPDGKSVLKHWNALSNQSTATVPYLLQTMFHTVVQEAREGTNRIYVKQKVSAVVMGPLHADHCIPLLLVKGYSEALLDNIATSSTQCHELIQVIYDESLRMKRFVEDLLDLSIWKQDICHCV